MKYHKTKYIIAFILLTLLSVNFVLSAPSPSTGNVFRSLTPEADETYNIGQSDLKWLDIYTKNITLNGSITQTDNVTSTIPWLELSRLYVTDFMEAGTVYVTDDNISGDLIVDGNVGIGTTTPWGKLAVENTGSGNSFIVGDEANDTTPFIIDADGNVGIGTLSPEAKLDVVGVIKGSSNLEIANGSRMGSAVIYFTINDSANTLTTPANIILNVEDTYIGNGANAYYMPRSDNLGLTANSGALITLNDMLFSANSNDSGTGNIVFGSGNTSTTGAFTEYMRIKDGGNVGIGTDSPDRALHLTPPQGLGYLRIERDDTSITVDDLIGAIEFEHQDTNNPGVGAIIKVIGEGTVGQTGISFFTGSPSTISEAVRIDFNGNVGIGTTTPAVKLSVNGIIQTEERSLATCNAQSEGGIYYDSDDSHFYGCDGSTWNQLD